MSGDCGRLVLTRRLLLTVGGLLVGLLAGGSALLAILDETVHAPHPDLLPAFANWPDRWPGVEPRDRVVFGLFVISVLAVTAISLFSRDRDQRILHWHKPLSLAVTVIASVLLAVNLAVHDDRLLPWEAYFSGFELFDLAVISFALALWLVWPTGHRLRSEFKVILQFAGCLLGSWWILFLIQHQGGVLDGFHTSVVANELIAVSAGRFPGFDFVPQYTIGLGYVFAVFDWLFRGDTVRSLFWFVSIMNLSIVAVVVIGIRWAWRSWSATVWPALLTIGAFTFTTRGFGMEWMSSVPNYWPVMPIRMTGLAFVVGGIMVLDCPLRRRVNELGGGVIVLLSLLVNIESGTAVFAGLATVCLVRRGLNRKYVGALARLAAPSFLAVLLLALAQHATDALCDLTCTTEAIALFGGMGYLSIDMPVFGSHMVILTGFVIAAAWASQCFRSASEKGDVDRVAALTLGVSAFGVFAAVYYVGRSYAALLTLVFPAFAVAMSGLWSLIGRNRPLSISRRMVYVPVMVVVLIPVAFLFNKPSPSDQMARLRGDIPEWAGSFTAELPGLDDVVEDLVVQHGISSAQIGLASGLAMPSAIRYGVTPAIAYHSHTVIVTWTQVERQCDVLSHLNLEVVVLQHQWGEDGFERALACAGFVYQGDATPTFGIYVQIPGVLRETVDEAWDVQSFIESSGPGIVVVDSQRLITGRGAFRPEATQERSNIELVRSIPGGTTNCGDGRLCDRSGRRIEVLVAVSVGTDWLIGLVPFVDAASADGSELVTLDGARFAGRIAALPECGTGDRATDTAIEGTVVIGCRGGKGTLDELKLWIAEGCTEQRNLQLCPIDPELDRVLEGAVTAGLFEPYAGDMLVVEDPTVWMDSGENRLSLLLAPYGLVVVDGFPDDAVPCGEAAVCDGDGRRLHVLAAIQDRADPFLVVAPVAGLGNGFAQTVVMINATTMFGTSDVVPTCDFEPDVTAAAAFEGVWTLRRCGLVAPVGFSTFRSWMTDGCEGRGGWWICPTEE